jgi:type IV secretion system protein VirD4
VHPAVRRGVNILKRLADRELSGVCSTASRALRLTLDPLVARMTSRSSFALSDLRERARPMSLYLTVPYSDQERLRPLSRLIIRQVLDYTTQHLGGWRHRLLMLIDEVQALKRMPTITSALTFVRGYGVNLCLVTPSLNALGDEAKHYIENAHIRVAYAPNDPAIAETFSRMAGSLDVEKARESVAQDAGQLFGRRTTRSLSTEQERLFSPTAVAFMPSDTGLLLVGNGGYPARVKKAPAYNNRRMKKRSRMEGARDGRSAAHTQP